MNHRISSIFILLLWSLGLHAQEPASLSNLKIRNIVYSDTAVKIDSLSIVPGSFQIPGIGPEYYSLNETVAILTWLRRPPSDTVKLMYRTFPYNLQEPLSRLNYENIRYNFLAEPLRVKASSAKQQSFMDFTGLQSQGSLGRSISFGNAQDAVLNSSLNLQLSGFIGDSLELSAAITDNNIPIQPDGTTRDLRDFDRIYLQVKKRGWQAGFGDLDIRFNKNYFLSFYKRLQGGNFSTQNSLGKERSNFFQFAGAIAKGKFNRQVLTPIEGNQGPYRLQGANNELFFVVLGGTERVFIDGELLQRGEDRDYVINYNTAEITFTPRRLIQKDRRIQVEFEYADRNYLNSQLFLHDAFSFNKKLSVNVSAYSNTDARNSTIDQPLTGSEKQFLAGIGDSVNNAYYSSAVAEVYSPDKILYLMKDTVYNGNITDTIFVLSADSSRQLYSVAFTYLGPGKGDYMPLLNAANGKVYQWVQPDINNNSKGEWAPVTLLVTPKQQQIFTVGMNYDLPGKTRVGAELAYGRYDINMFSDKDKGNDGGGAAKFTLQQELGNAGKWKMAGGAGYEYVSSVFRPVERLRNVEFLRDWSLPFDSPQEEEHLINGFLSADKGAGNKLRYEITSYNRKGSYEGIRQILEQATDVKGWKMTGRLNLLDFSTDINKGTYFRPYAELKRTFAKASNLQFSFKYTGEYNRAKLKSFDSLSRSSFGFEVFEFLVNSDARKLNKWSFYYFRRQDRLPAKDDLLRADKSDNFNFTTELFKNPVHQVRINVSYRNLHIIREELSRLRPEQSLLGRLEYNFSPFKGFITGNFFYESGTGQELKREFSYVAVPPGQGEFTWIDYNNNGIEELNEFEVGVFQDQRRYIRIFTPGNTYVKANYLQFNYNVDLNPRNLIKPGSGGLLKLLYKTSSSSALQINKKQIARNDFLFDPFSRDLEDSNLISLSTFLSNTLYYNRTDPKWGIEVTHSLNSVKSLLVYGFESRTLENLITRLRFRLGQSWVAAMTYRFSGNDLISSNPIFSNRNYKIRQHTTEPSLTYLWKSNLRIVFSYLLTTKENTIGAGEQTRTHDLNTEIRYNILSGAGINAKLTYMNIEWNGNGAPINSTAGFILLGGLQPGSNILWNIDLTKRIGNNLELNMQYEGRKPSSAGTVHIGRAAIRALF